VPHINTRGINRPLNKLRILSFVRRASRPTITEITSADPNEALDNFIQSDDITLTAQFPSEGEVSLYEWQYRALASRYHLEYSFAIVTSSHSSPPSSSKTLHSESQKEAVSKIRCHNNQTKESYTLRELHLVNALEELIRQCTTPLILEPLSRRDISELGTQIGTRGARVVVHYFAGEEGTKVRYKDLISSLAKRYSSSTEGNNKGAVVFTIMDVRLWPGMAGMVGLDGFSDDGVVGRMAEGIAVEDLSKGEVFPFWFRDGKGEEGGIPVPVPVGRLEFVLREVLAGPGTVKAWDGMRVDGDGNGDGGVHDEL